MAKENNDEDPCLKFKTDPRYLSWIGASIIPKLESSKDMFISREKYLCLFQNYRDQFQEQKCRQIKQFLAGQEEKKKDENAENEVQQQPSAPSELTRQQEQVIDGEVSRKLRRERGLDGGIKIVREKIPFIW